MRNEDFVSIEVYSNKGNLSRTGYKHEDFISIEVYSEIYPGQDISSLQERACHSPSLLQYASREYAVCSRALTLASTWSIWSQYGCRDTTAQEKYTERFHLVIIAAM